MMEQMAGLEKRQAGHAVNLRFRSTLVSRLRRQRRLCAVVCVSDVGYYRGVDVLAVADIETVKLAFSVTNSADVYTMSHENTIFS